MSKTVKIYGIDWKVGDVIAEYIAALEEDVRQRGALELDALGKIAGLEAELAKHEWVDKNERLPEEGQNVLIFGHERHHGVPFSAIWDWKSKNVFNTHWKTITLPQIKEQSNDK